MNIMNAQFNLHEFYVLSFRVIKTMISPKRVNNIFAAFKSLKTRKDHVPGMPSVMMVEPSAICNMQCPVCALYVQPIRKPSFLDFELYKKILNELESSVIILTLWNWGEPLLNPEIGSMVALATKKKILTSITTNGMELKGKIAEELISGGLCHLVVSLDSASPEVYNKLRGYGFFNEIISNVSDFITIRNRKRSKLPLVELKMLVTRDNENEIEEFKNLKFITGVDRIRFRRLVWAHNPELIEKAPTISSFRMPHGIIKNGKTISCSRPWFSSVILANGDVVPCCSDAFFQFVMGNVKEPGGFSAIWNNAKYRNFRRKLLEDPQSLSICSTCPSASFRGDTYLYPEFQS